MNSHKISIGNTTPIKILTVAVGDTGARSVLKNKGRMRLLKDIASSIKHNTDISDADLVCLPGGYFFTNKFVGNLSFDDRKTVLERENFHEVVKTFCDIFPKMTLILGIDARPVLTTNYDLHFEVEGRNIKAVRKSDNLFASANQVSFKERGCELCVAYKNGEIIGIGRKIFPVHHDLKQFIPNCTGCEIPGNHYYEINEHYSQKHTLVAYYNDFNDPKRIIEVKGQKILLCNCYDMFGVMIEPEENHLQTHSARRRYIGTISKDGRLYSELDGKEFYDIRNAAIQNWNDFLKIHKPTIAVTTIHSFNEPNGANFWMRHGIATASATLTKIAGKPCLGIGAAHFVYGLPSENQANLCSFGVAENHIYKGQYRPLLDHKPQHFMEDMGIKWPIWFVVKGCEVEI